MKKGLFTGIIISMLLLVLPAAASDQALSIYGNTNEDEVINMQDVTYTELIILEYKDATELADAKYDNNIDILDVTQIELIILGKEKKLTFIDATENTVTVDLPIERMVTLNSDFAEAIAVLDERDKVVGVTTTITEYNRLLPQLRTKTDVGGWSTPDIEAILSTDPDTICVYAKWPTTEKLDDMVPDNINIIRMDLYKSETLREEMIILGYLLNKRGIADKYITWHDQYVDVINERVFNIQDDDKVRVFIDSGGGKTLGRQAYSTGTGMHDLVVCAGGVNIAKGYVEGYADVETEWILDENPDVICGISFKGGYETDDNVLMKDFYNEIIALPGFDNVAAVQNDRVRIMSNSYAFAPHYPAALTTMATWLYPDTFSDMDPELIHQEYIDDFLGIDFDVTQIGVFEYPPLES